MKKILTALLLAAAVNTAAAKTPESAAQLSDNDTSTAYIAEGDKTEVLFTGFTAPVVSYKLYSSGENAECDPCEWTLYGSRNGRKWEVIDHRTQQEFCSRFQEISATIAEPGAYTAYKLRLKGSRKQKRITLGEVKFFDYDVDAKWRNFVDPKVSFRIENPESAGAKAYSELVQDPEAYAKYHARKVAEILFDSDRDSIRYIQQVNYILRDFDGIAYKSGRRGTVEIHFSTRHIEKSAARSLKNLDFETRGVLYHELVHGYQYNPKGCGSYGTDKTFWSFIEGVADAVRAQSGHFNMRTRRPGGNWLDGYRTTGFFIQWMTRDDPDAIRKFHRTALELPVWSWDAAIKHLYGPEASIESKWEEYQQWLKSDDNRNQLHY